MSDIGIHQGVSEFDVAHCAPLCHAGIVTVSVATEPPYDRLFRVQLQSQQFRRHRFGHIGLDTQSDRGHAGESAKLVRPRWPTLPRLTSWGGFYLVVYIFFFPDKSNLFIVTRIFYCEKSNKNKTKSQKTKTKIWPIPLSTVGCLRMQSTTKSDTVVDLFNASLIAFKGNVIAHSLAEIDNESVCLERASSLIFTNLQAKIASLEIYYNSKYFRFQFQIHI